MPEIIMDLLRESATLAFAAFALWMLKRSYDERTKAEGKRADEWKDQREQERDDKLLVTNVLREVSASQAELSTRMAEMCAVMRLSLIHI